MRVKMLSALFVGLALVFSTALAASAYPIRDLSLFEKVYLEGTFGNATVMIIDIDYSGNRVKVQRDDGFSEWVNPSRIMSKMENTVDQISDAIGVALIAQCSFMIDNCDSGRLGRMIHDGDYHLGDPMPKQGGGFLPKQPPTPSQNGDAPDFMNPDADWRLPEDPVEIPYTPVSPPPAPAVTQPEPITSKATVESAFAAEQVRLFVQNDCHETIDVTYALKTSGFERSFPFVMHLLPGERKAIAVGSYTEFDRNAEVFFTATSASFGWNGEQDITIDRATHPYKKGKLEVMPNQERLLGVTCTN